jgi:hypothetical protein
MAIDGKFMVINGIKQTKMCVWPAPKKEIEKLQITVQVRCSCSIFLAVATS